MNFPGQISPNLGSYSPDDYFPKKNATQVRTYPRSTSVQHLRIPDYPLPDQESPDKRSLTILTDTCIELEGGVAELIHDARFVFGALLRARKDELGPQDYREISSWEGGLQSLGEADSAGAANLGTRFHRAVNALDAFAIEASNQILINRARWGSGYTSYAICEDVAIKDMRGH